MRVVLDRFQPPGPRDEKATCQNCLTEFHYEELDEWGFCKNCRVEEEDEDNSD
jgi:hypothetical protein